jgi:hypothetical protein
MSNYANYMLGAAKREEQRRGHRDPRQATDLHLSSGFAQRLRTANTLLRTAKTEAAIANILRPLWQAMADARRQAALRGDLGRAAEAERRMAGLHRMADRAEGELR